ncbi:MAG: DOMON-like domain-containing protein [Caulobacterales bacterium]
MGEGPLTLGALMRQALKLHPDCRCPAVTRIEAGVARLRAGGLTLVWVVTGDIGDLALPPMTSPTRADGLWRHTCFEGFVRAAPGEAYFELNFAPSTQWAAYGFSGYRAGMRALGEIAPPRIEVRRTASLFDLRVSLDLDRLAGLPDDAAWRAGLSAVIEETNGRKSYWALAHPPGGADFHHAEGFALGLPPPEPS